MAEIKQPPIIIKRIKKAGHAYHGGAWKVAYADFVTAMMAFFLLMWLLNATSEEQKLGLADYFAPTVGLKDSMGIGFEGGQSKDDGTAKSDKTKPGIIAASPPQGVVLNLKEVKPSPEDAESDSQLFEKTAEALKQALQDDPALRELGDSIILEQTPEGLKIEVLDLNRRPMFEPGTATLSGFGTRMLSKIGEVIRQTPNALSITGHTDTTAFAASTEYTNWELSSDRAQASRRYMTEHNLNAKRIAKIVGVADREPLKGEAPDSPRNRRITIVLLRGVHVDTPDADLPAPREILSVPKVKPGALIEQPPAPPPIPERPAAGTPAGAAPAH